MIAMLFFMIFLSKFFTFFEQIQGKLYPYQIFLQFQDVLDSETSFALYPFFPGPGFPFNSSTNFMICNVEIIISILIQLIKRAFSHEKRKGIIDLLYRVKPFDFKYILHLSPMFHTSNI